MSLKMHADILGSGWLGPGQTVTWFWDNARLNAVRWFYARPRFGDQVPWDQTITVEKDFQIMKGTNHAADGPSVPGSLQPNVVVHNLDQNNGAFYLLYYAEIYEA